jgi:hypothetical protein
MQDKHFMKCQAFRALDILLELRTAVKTALLKYVRYGLRKLYFALAIGNYSIQPLWFLQLGSRAHPYP